MDALSTDPFLGQVNVLGTPLHQPPHPIPCTPHKGKHQGIEPGVLSSSPEDSLDEATGSVYASSEAGDSLQKCGPGSADIRFSTEGLVSSPTLGILGNSDWDPFTEQKERVLMPRLPGGCHRKVSIDHRRGTDSKRKGVGVRGKDRQGAGAQLIEAHLACTRPWVQSPAPHKLCMVVHACNPSI